MGQLLLTTNEMEGSQSPLLSINSGVNCAQNTGSSLWSSPQGCSDDGVGKTEGGDVVGDIEGLVVCAYVGDDEGPGVGEEDGLCVGEVVGMQIPQVVWQ
jgi:hypothetical protein